MERRHCKRVFRYRTIEGGFADPVFALIPNGGNSEVPAALIIGVGCRFWAENVAAPAN